MKYNKLVRDNIPEIVRAKGEKILTHVAREDEYWQKLKEKLEEEVQEFISSEKPDELADIEEIIDAICAYKKIDRNEIIEIQQKKAEERGKFEKRIVLEES